MKPQIIKTETGEELVVLPRRAYDQLVRRGGEEGNEEDAGTARIVARTVAALKAGREALLPAEIAQAIASGENALRVVRKWRGITQQQLGEVKTDIGQSYVSQLESGAKKGTPDVFRKLAAALKVPVDLLIPD